MISAKHWELAAALAVLEQAQMEAAALRDAKREASLFRVLGSYPRAMLW